MRREHWNIQKPLIKLADNYDDTVHPFIIVRDTFRVRESPIKGYLERKNVKFNASEKVIELMYRCPIMVISKVIPILIVVFHNYW